MSETKRTAIEKWTMEAVEAVLPEGTPAQKQRLAIIMLQARAKECRSMATMFKLQNPRNPIVHQVADHMINREHQLEKIALKWSEPDGWPPKEGSSVVGEPLVRLN